jgi:beta-glucosidase
MSDIGIQKVQQNLLKALLGTGKPVVLVLINGRPMTLQWENANVSAILEAWAGGTEAGNAVASILFGDYNPSGKLTTTFPISVGQIPLYYNHKNTGRPMDPKNKFTSKYLDISNDPVYPFGYGLSYTTFEYSDLKLSKTQLKGEEKLTASVTLTNTGKVAGEEVVQLYIQQPAASVSRPVKELKNFKKVLLQPGEKKDINIEIGTNDLKFYNSDLKYDWEPGDFIIYMGTNSRDTKSARVNWVK